MARSALLLVVCSVAVGCLAEYKPADSVSDLNAVEEALHKVENATLSPEQRRAAASIVKKVDQVVVQLSTDKTLTKAQKLEKTKVAIQELEGLQAQWELSEVEGALSKVADLPHLSPQQRANAKKVVTDVEAIAKDVEAGKLTGAEKKKRVGFAIQELQALQKDWFNSTTASRVQALKQELAEKKMLLKKDEAEIKLASLEKELAEKKLILKKFTAAKDRSQNEEKQRREDQAQEAMVAKLLATAKALAISKKKQPAGVTASAAANQTKAAAQEKPDLSALVTDLQARARNVSADIAHMDAEEKKRQAALSTSIEAGAKAPAAAKTDALEKGQKMLQRLSKQEHRNFLKARAVKESQVQELDQGVRSIQKGDVTTLTKLLQKMQNEQKSMQAKSKNFLY